MLRKELEIEKSAPAASGDERMGRMEHSRVRQREVTKEAKRAFLLSLPANGHSGHWPLWDVQGLHQLHLLIVCHTVVCWVGLEQAREEVSV